MFIMANLLLFFIHTFLRYTVANFDFVAEESDFVAVLTNGVQYQWSKPTEGKGTRQEGGMR